MIPASELIVPEGSLLSPDEEMPEARAHAHFHSYFSLGHPDAARLSEIAGNHLSIPQRGRHSRHLLLRHLSRHFGQSAPGPCLPPRILLALLAGAFAAQRLAMPHLQGASWPRRPLRPRSHADSDSRRHTRVLYALGARMRLDRAKGESTAPLTALLRGEISKRHKKRHNCSR